MKAGLRAERVLKISRETQSHLCPGELTLLFSRARFFSSLFSIFLSFFLRAVQTVSVVMHCHKAVTSLRLRFSRLARLSLRRISSLGQWIVRLGVQSLSEMCSDTAGCPHTGGNYSVQPVIF